MSEQAKPSRAKDRQPPAESGLKAGDVVRFLQDNPDFFLGREALLEAMTPPKRWTGDGVVDMQKYVLDRLRGEIDALRRDALEVIETSRGNMSSQSRVHAAALALIEAPDFDGLAHVIADDLPLLLDVDVATLGFEPAGRSAPMPPAAPLREFKPGTVDAVFGPDRQVLLLGELGDDGTLFGAAAGLVRSAALARLRPGPTTPTGILALGSRDTTFQPGQGTELVVFLARVVETCILKCLEKPD